VRHFLLSQVLPGESPDALKDDTPLVTGGILDSIATMKLAAYLEEQFRIELQPHELSADYLDTITDIVKLVRTKQAN
jgi:acyl carrier protein